MFSLIWHEVVFFTTIALYCFPAGLQSWVCLNDCWDIFNLLELPSWLNRGSHNQLEIIIIGSSSLTCSYFIVTHCRCELEELISNNFLYCSLGRG